MKCPVCQNCEFRAKQLLPEIKVERCIQCGFLISDINRTRPVRSEFSQINQRAYQQSVGFVRRRQAGEILRLVSRYIEPVHDWLDIGCSFGYMLHEAQNAGYSVFGVEPDAEAYAQACALVGSEFVHHGPMHEGTRRDQSADVISTLDVLEHIPPYLLADFARRIHRKLRPEGLWVIKVPSTEGLCFTIAHRLPPFLTSIMAGVLRRLWQSEYEYPHTVFFNRNTLEKYLENYDYELMSVSYLEDVPNSTVVNRLLMDNSIPRWQALAGTPALYIINTIEKLRGMSDAVLAIARRKDKQHLAIPESLT